MCFLIEHEYSSRKHGDSHVIMFISKHKCTCTIMQMLFKSRFCFTALDLSMQ